jgi:hypothetical protein
MKTAKPRSFAASPKGRTVPFARPGGHRAVFAGDREVPASQSQP